MLHGITLYRISDETLGKNMEIMLYEIFFSVIWLIVGNVGVPKKFKKINENKRNIRVCQGSRKKVFFY